MAPSSVALVSAASHRPRSAEDQLKIAQGAAASARPSCRNSARTPASSRSTASRSIFSTPRAAARRSRSSSPTPRTSAVTIGFLGTIGAYAKGAPVRIIGSTFTGGNQLFWYVRADSPIKSLKDAAGKTVAYSTNGSSTHTAVLALKKFTGADFVPTQTGAAPAHLHPGDERPDRRRLGRRAVRRRCGRAGQDPRHRQGVGRSGAGPADHPAADRQRQRDGAAPRRVRALHARLSRGAGLGLFDAGGTYRLCQMGEHFGGDRQARARRVPAEGRRSIPTASPASTTSWRTR